MADGSKKSWMPSVEQWRELFRGLSLNYEDDSLPSANEETSFEKIYVLVRYSHSAYLSKCFMYYIDLSSAWKYDYNTIQPLQPILQFREVLDSHNFNGYVVVGCILFLFDVSISGRPDSGRSMCYYDFSGDLCSSTTINVEEKSLKSGPLMESIKEYPFYAVVGGSKICVFEAMLYRCFKKGYQWSQPPSFEVFDTTKWTWTKLPELPMKRREFDEVIITSYCVEGSCLIICADSGIWGINIDAKIPEWVKIEGSERMEICPFNGRWTMVGEHMCTPFEVARWGVGKTHPLEFVNKESLIPVDDDGILCSERVDYGYTVCGVHFSFRGEAEEPALLVNVTKLNTYSLNNFTAEMWKTIECDRSAIIPIEYEDFEDMELVGCFQIKEKKRSHGVPLNYPRYKKDDYETMEEWRLDLLLSQYGFTLTNATILEKRDFAMGAFLWDTAGEVTNRKNSLMASIGEVVEFFLSYLKVEVSDAKERKGSLKK